MITIMSKNKQNIKYIPWLITFIVFFIISLCSFLFLNFFHLKKNKKAEVMIPEPTPTVSIYQEEKLIDDLVDTKDWVTYKNQSLGFKLKYPQDFYLYDKNINFCEGCYSKLYEMTAISKIKADKSIISTGELADNSSILISNISKYENFEEIIRKPGVKLEEIGDFKFYCYNPSQNPDRTSCLISDDKIILSVWFDSYDSVNSKDYADIYKTILSTLQPL